MALLFVGGVMNLIWVAAIATFVLLEKVTPKGEMIGRAGGVLLIVFAGFVAFHS
jgi:predicted metal-binding membrane protein